MLPTYIEMDTVRFTNKITVGTEASLSMRSMSYRRKLGDYFFPELLV
jgi:hypothetical protein